MSEKNDHASCEAAGEYDFDHVPSRVGSGSYKWDSADSPDVIPLWVADMDFPTAPCVIEALQRRVAHGIFGYTRVPDSYYDALCGWFARRHGYGIDRRRVIYTSGVVPAISAIIKALTKPGDGVIVQTPIYNCFFSSIRNNGCRQVDAPLRRVEIGPQEFTYEMDFEALEAAAADPSNKLLLLCNPHNPAGKIWTRADLERVSEICNRHGVKVISDEIHCELTRPGLEYVPYGTVDANAVVCVSPSKAFNTAGLQIANIVCPDEQTQALIDRAINVNEVCDVNPFGVVGLEAAYTPGGERWLDALRRYLWENEAFAREYLNFNLPLCPVATLDATYLLWVDVSSLGIPAEEMEHRMVSDAKVWVNAGEMYGRGGYIRINLACPRALLAEGLRRLTHWIDLQSPTK